MLAYGADYDWYLDCMTKMGLKLAGKLIIGSDSNFGEEGTVLQCACELGNNL